MLNHSYSNTDVIMLLKDLSGSMAEMTAQERETLIQSGVHYSEMLPQEKVPSKEYEDLYEKALKDKSYEIASGSAELAKMIARKFDGGIDADGCKNTPVILSLARAGIPIGVLLKRCLVRMGIDAPHFAISIIRDKGIDINAMNYIYDYCKERNIAVGANILFVDGWTGKGVIAKQVEEAVTDLKTRDAKWAGLSDDLYVLADPANITQHCATHKDYMLPSACLNSTCAGLISRTILNDNIGPDDFHGAVIFDKFRDIDKSREFVDVITKEIDNNDMELIKKADGSLKPIEGKNGMETVFEICKDYGVKDYKKVKPGIGETTRVLLRRIPYMVLVNKDIDMNDGDIAHILMLCRDKNVPIERYDLGNYKVCGIIKELSDV